MTTSQAGPIETFLADLAACLPATASTGDMLSEARDHLLEAAAARKAAGASQQTAERDAVREFGRIEELAPDFRTVVLVRDAQRQARWQLATVALLGAWGISAFRLVPLWRGELTDLRAAPDGGGRGGGRSCMPVGGAARAQQNSAFVARGRMDGMAGQSSNIGNLPLRPRAAVVRGDGRRPGDSPYQRAARVAAGRSTRWVRGCQASGTDLS